MRGLASKSLKNKIIKQSLLSHLRRSVIVISQNKGTVEVDHKCFSSLRNKNDTRNADSTELRNRTKFEKQSDKIFPRASYQMYDFMPML